MFSGAQKRKRLSTRFLADLRISAKKGVTMVKVVFSVHQ
jgi:hypothetical protein